MKNILTTQILPPISSYKNLENLDSHIQFM